MTRTAAAKRAAAEISMYRSGNGWIVSEWDENVGCRRLSEERPFALARQAVAERRAERVSDLTTEGWAWHVVDGTKRHPAGYVGTYATREQACEARSSKCRMGGYITRVRGRVRG